MSSKAKPIAVRKMDNGSTRGYGAVELEDRVKEYEAKLFSMPASERYAFRCVGYVPTHFDLDWCRAVAEYKRRKYGRKHAISFE